MGNYPLIGIIWYMSLRMGISVTTEESEINKSILNLLDKENPNFEDLLREAKKYGIDTEQYETPVYIDKNDNLCLNVRLMKGNDTKLAINKEIQHLYVQVPSKCIFPTNEEMIIYLASVLNVSRDSLQVADNFADRRTIVVSSHVSLSDVVDTIVAVATGNYLSEDGNTILSVSTDDLRKLIRAKYTLPPDLHNIKDIDKGDVARLAKILGIEPLPSAVTKKSHEKSKSAELQINQKDGIREDNSQQINEVREVMDLNNETEFEKTTSKVTESLDIHPTQTYVNIMKNKVTKYSYKLRKTAKTKGSEKGKRKTKSKIASRKTIRKSKTVNAKVKQKKVNTECNAEQMDTESEHRSLNTKTETEKKAKTLKVLTTEAAKKTKKKTKAEVGKTKAKPKRKSKIKKTKTVKSKTKVKGKTKTAKLKTKTIKPKIKKKVIKAKYIPVIQDDKDNIVIRVKVTRGDSNKLLKVESKRETRLATVDIQIQAPKYQEAFENEMARYMSQVLGVGRKDIKLFIDENQIIKKVLVPKEKLEKEVAKQKLKDAFNNIHKFSLIQ